MDLLIINAGAVIAAIAGLLVGLIGAIVCIKMVSSSNTPPDRKPWWAGGIVAGALMVVLAVLTLGGVI